MNYTIMTVNGSWVDVTHDALMEAARNAGLMKHEGATDEVAKHAKHYYNNAVRNIKDATGAMPENEEEFKILLSRYFFDGDNARGDALWEMIEGAIGMGALKMLGCWED